MEVLYVEDLANRNGPESCADVRKGGGEALTGVHAGRVSSREKLKFRGPTLWRQAEGNMGRCVMASTGLTLRGLRPLARGEQSPSLPRRAPGTVG